MSKTSDPRFKEVDVLRDAEGIIAVISQHVQHPTRFGIAIFKEFERDGEKVRTTYFDSNLCNAVLRLMPLAQKRTDELKKLEIDRNNGDVETKSSGRAERRHTSRA